MRHLVVIALAALTSWGTACSGSTKQIEFGPVPERLTVGTLSGPLCRDQRCTCATSEGDVGVPEGGRKRFEFRLESAQELWLTLPSQVVLYKDRETTRACFYVDFAAGEHPIELRAKDAVGVSAELYVRELGSKTQSFYDTFHFECGNPGACSYDELDALRAHYATFTRNLHDKCGSTRVKGILWDHGKAPDQVHPSDLIVRATLDLYTFAPWKPHGDATCGEGGGRPPTDEPAASDPVEPAPAGATL